MRLIHNKHSALRVAIILIISSFLINACDGTLSKSDKKSKKPKKANQPKKREEQVENVKARGLVQSEYVPNNILNEHSMYCQAEMELRQFKGPVLAYVTPWNSKGYDIAKTFHKKFTMVSPVWLQVTPKKNNEFAMAGGHDIDSDWAKQVVRGGDSALVPRVLFDKWTIEDYQNMFSSEAIMGKCAKTITSFIKKHGFGGVTIEIWSQMPAMLHSDVIHFLIDLAFMLHKSNKLLILVVPPLQLSASAASPSFTQEHFEQLKDSVDYFSIMTYDYHAQSGVAGPISPLPWVEKTITTLSPEGNAKDRSKLLLGINFYGMKFGERSGANPVVGHEFISILSTQDVQAMWQKKDAEHIYSFKDEKTDEQAYLLYPSLLFLQERLELAKRLGTGISIWEIGQGLDYFYDLL